MINQNDENSVGHRIKSIRNALGLNQEIFGKTIGITKSAVCTYENGTRNPKDTTLNNICKKYRVNHLYITTGEGEMFSENYSPDYILDALCNQYNLDYTDKMIIAAYIRTPKEDRMKFAEFCTSLAVSLKKEYSEISIEE